MIMDLNVFVSVLSRFYLLTPKIDLNFELYSFIQSNSLIGVFTVGTACATEGLCFF